MRVLSLVCQYEMVAGACMSAAGNIGDPDLDLARGLRQMSWADLQRQQVPRIKDSGYVRELKRTRSRPAAQAS